MENLVLKTVNGKKENFISNLSKLTKVNLINLFEVTNSEVTKMKKDDLINLIEELVKKDCFIQIPPQETKEEKITYLKEGVTGKQVMRSIYDANNEHKVDLGTFSQCLKRAIQFNKFDTVVNNFNVNELTPKNLMPFRSKANEGKEKFSVYEVLMMIKKFYQAK